MKLFDISAFKVLRHKMLWHQARQKVLAQNVANADTPSFVPKDINRPNFREFLASTRKLDISVNNTSSLHLNTISGGAMRDEFNDNLAADWETTPSGNAVILEEQMMKISENQLGYQTATSLYAKTLGIIKTAIGHGTR